MFRPTKEELFLMYIDNKLSAREIGERYNVSKTSVFRWLKKNNIEIRTSGESNKGRTTWNKGLTKNTDDRIKDGWSKGLTKETNKSIEKASVKNTGKILSKETKNKISKSHIGKTGLSGKLNPRFGKPGTMLNKKHSKKSKAKMSGKNNHFYIDGRTKENSPYCDLYNDEFKEYIRNKWFRKCLLCGKSEGKRKLPTHHVDYNKMQGCNTTQWKVIPLCNSCHPKTNPENMRDYFDYLFSTLIYIKEILEDYNNKIDYRSLKI